MGVFSLGTVYPHQFLYWCDLNLVQEGPKMDSREFEDLGWVFAMLLVVFAASFGDFFLN